jgi:hypothetical protein
MDKQKIRETAYGLWEKQGKPQGQDLEHWFTAEKSLGEEDSDSLTSESTPGSDAPGVAEENFTDGVEDRKEE